MTILCDTEIINEITILVDNKTVRFNRPEKKRISAGITSYGYDMALSETGFRIFDSEKCMSPVVDPKETDWHSDMSLAQLHSKYIDGERHDYYVIPPNSFALGESVEVFEIPRDILGVCVGKSTYARCGIIVNVTPLEPEWKGKVTIEISNTTPRPAVVYVNEGISQVLFMRASQVCERSYDDKKGKYQNQIGLTMPIVE